MAIAIVFAIFLFLLVLLTIIPMVPGVPLMFLMTIVYGLLDHFQTIKPWHLVFFASLAALSIVIDNVGGIVGAKIGGAHKRSLMFGMLGLLVGLVVFPPLGAIAGLFLGVFLAEAARSERYAKPLKAATFALLGSLSGMIAKVFLAAIYYVVFLVIIFS